MTDCVGWLIAVKVPERPCWNEHFFRRDRSLGRSVPAADASDETLIGPALLP